MLAIYEVFGAICIYVMRNIIFQFRVFYSCLFLLAFALIVLTQSFIALSVRALAPVYL